MAMLTIILTLLCLCVGARSWNIKDLPGLNFKINFRQHSGYLDSFEGSQPTRLFYWLIESQTNHSEQDPLVLWLNGGPGCSSLRGYLGHLGPLHVDRDGEHLFENPFSWNKAANMLFVESPAGVGFTKKERRFSLSGTNTNDDEVARLNHLGLKSFFKQHPEFKGRDFYISGVSYFGVYGPTLARLIIRDPEFPAKFKGMTIGNGVHSFSKNRAAAVRGAFYRGLITQAQFDEINRDCCEKDQSPLTCDYKKAALESWQSKCVRTIEKNGGGISGRKIGIFFSMPSKTAYRPSLNNYYGECYEEESDTKIKFSKAKYPNYETTSVGLPCWIEEATYSYLNKKSVQAAIHVDSVPQQWMNCSHLEYKNRYKEMDAVYADILKESNISILIYNGDVDLKTDFRGAEDFVEGITKDNGLKELKPRTMIIHRGVSAGYSRVFERIHFVIVKGAGHYATMDRPGPTLQMFSNFLKGSNDYSKPFDDGHTQ